MNPVDDCVALTSPLARPFARGAAYIVDLWLRSLRIHLRRADGRRFRAADFSPDPSIYAVSERDLFAIAAMARHSEYIVLADTSPDAEWAVALASSLRCRFVRGSSLHGGVAALRELISAITSSSSPVMIAVDGPVGPAGEAKAGAVVCAARTDRAIVPAAAAAPYRIRFGRTWAGYYLPLPWSRVSIALGEPMRIAATASRQEIDAAACSISIQLRELTRSAEAATESSGD
ncbi:MAG TPA: DUF374 domain-containing protein [Thermoanaerobaculia bacterium]|nr:DUF374 domain-containing protein [Thermoanaerobaculia bacterium]